MLTVMEGLSPANTSVSADHITIRYAETSGRLRPAASLVPKGEALETRTTRCKARSQCSVPIIHQRPVLRDRLDIGKIAEV